MVHMFGYHSVQLSTLSIGPSLSPAAELPHPAAGPPYPPCSSPEMPPRHRASKNSPHSAPNRTPALPPKRCSPSRHPHPSVSASLFRSPAHLRSPPQTPPPAF